MTVGMMDIWHHEGLKRPLLGLDMWSRDALANYARVRWPTNTAKQVAREWDLSLDEAKGVISSRTSQTTIDKILKHRNGGWRVAIPILGAVIGRDLDGFLAEEQGRLSRERQQYEATEQQVAEMAGHVRALFGLGAGRHGEPVDRLASEQGRGLGAQSDAPALGPDAIDHGGRP